MFLIFSFQRSLAASMTESERRAGRGDVYHFIIRIWIIKDTKYTSHFSFNIYESPSRVLSQIYDVSSDSKDV